MLEIRRYTRDEISKILNVNAKQQIDRKLQRLDIQFSSSGRGNSLVYDIQEVPNPFKIYCILELGIPTVVCFEKFKEFCFYLFCDETFREFPIVEMQRILSAEGLSVSRQTISKWIQYFERANYISRNKAESNFYVINTTLEGEKLYTEVSQEDYCKGWRLYWDSIGIHGTRAAYNKMREYLGGHPYRCPKITQNGIYSEQIEKLIELVNDSFLCTHY